MSAAFRYLAGGVLRRLALLTPLLVLVYVAFALGDQGRRLAARVGWTAALSATALHAPLIAAEVLPAALMIACALWLSGLRRRGELDALRLAGATATTLARPLIAVGVLTACASGALLQWIVPPCERAAHALEGHSRSALTGLGAPPAWQRHGRWLLHRGPGDLVLALEIDSSGRVTRRVVGKSNALALPVLGKAAPLWRSPRAEALGYLELRALVAARRAAGQRRVGESLVLASKLTFPLANVVVALFAVGLALGQRRRSVAAELTTASFALLALWGLLAGAWLLARAGWASAHTACWGSLAFGAAIAAMFAWRRGGLRG